MSDDEPAKPVKNSKGKWVCSKCKSACYYDGRIGDPPILWCEHRDDDFQWEPH